MLKKKNIGSIAWLTIVVAYLIPFYAYACYTVPLADDFNMAASTYRAWTTTGSVLKVIVAAAKWSHEFFNTWTGEYICTFLQSLPVGLGNYRLYFLSSWIVLSIFVCAVYYFGKVFLRDCLDADTKKCFILSSAVLLLILTFMPEIYDAFYWHTASVSYTLSTSVKLIFVALFFKSLYIETTQKLWKRIILCVVAFLSAGFECSFSQTPFFMIVSIFFVICLLQKKNGIWAGVYWMMTTVGWLITLLAPGNMARQSGNYGETAGVIFVIWEALNRGTIAISEYMNLPLLLITLFVVPVMYSVVKKSKIAYRFPGLFTLFSVAVYASMYAPWIFSRGIEAPSPFGGDSGYVTNVFWITFVVLWFANVLYWVGWIEKNLIGELDLAVKQKVQKWKVSWYGVIILLLVFWSVRLEHVMEYGGPRLLWHLANGNAKTYYSVMEEREELLLSGSEDVLVLPKAEMPIGTCGAGDISTDETNWVNRAVQVYYDLDCGIKKEE